MAYIGATPTAVPLTGADIEDGTIGVADLSATLDLSSKTVTLPSGTGGKVLQVVQSVKTDTFTSSSTSFIDITGLSVSITPASSSNKVLVFAHIVGHGAAGTNHAMFRIVRDTTAIYAGDTAGSRTSGFHSGIVSDANTVEANTGVFLDSPSTTSATTYKIQGLTNAATLYVNRTTNDSDSSQTIRAASSITAMEISG